jgi:hypothetical protein
MVQLAIMHDLLESGLSKLLCRYVSPLVQMTVSTFLHAFSDLT